MSHFLGISSTGSYWGGGGEQIETLSGNLLWNSTSGTSTGPFRLNCASSSAVTSSARSCALSAESLIAMNPIETLTERSPDPEANVPSRSRQRPCADGFCA